MKASQLIRDLATEIIHHGDREIVFNIDGNKEHPKHYEIEPYIPSSDKIGITIW